jgi:hypothetical protein
MNQDDDKIIHDKILKLRNEMIDNYEYPLPEDEDFQKKIYEKREYHYHRLPGREELKTYDDVKNYRDKICSRKFELYEHQALLSNYINPDTPYKGLLIFHGTGTGKSCVGIAIAEKFKDLVEKYGTKIHILVSGPLVKENWKKELIKCTGNTYIAAVDQTMMVTENDIAKNTRDAMNTALQYYKFMSYRSFYKKVLGEKIKEEVKDTENKTKSVYKKTTEGDYERDIAIDKLVNLNNTLLIVDEAHHITGNNFGDALSLIIKNSYNLKIVLLSATPMKNLADDIVPMLNFLRPQDDLIMRDKIFTSNKNYMMEFKKNGIEYLKKMASGYVSYLRGADPITFAKRIEIGKIPKGLLFTSVIQCKMLPFQRKYYDMTSHEINDTLDRKSTAVSNFVFPALSPDHKEITGFYGVKGLTDLKNQLKIYSDKINEYIKSEILKNESSVSGELLKISDSDKTITGNILKIENLKYFSIKFYKALKNLNKLVEGVKGPRTAFIYSNLVKVGVELFEEILKMNGFLEYNDQQNYTIDSETVCYYCGKTFTTHKTNENPTHEFHPAIYLLVTGQSTEEGNDIIPEEKKIILDNVYSNINNKEGKYIKFVLGSKVMSEALSLRNVAEVHILDVYYNLGMVDQVIGRAIRGCSHYDIINDDNKYPEVHVYKYTVSLENGLSSEEELYKKAEQKYILIKKCERVLKEIAIDCPLNRNGNIFPEELKLYNNCVEPHIDNANDNSKIKCPALCDYTNCNFKCSSKKLNELYFNDKYNEYLQLKKENLDYNTFTKTLATNEINYVITKIRELYRIKFIYTIEVILNYVKKSYDKHKIDLFDEFFVYKALDLLIPITENDFNIFKHILYDKFNRQGYLIYVNKYYIFQPFNQSHDVPMYYRSTHDYRIKSDYTLYNYLNSTKLLDEYNTKKITKKKSTISIYEYDTDYYDSRPENKYIGILDKESTRKWDKSMDELADVFKIRDKRSKILDKRRGTGIPSLKGAVCVTKEKGYVKSVAKYLDVDILKNDTRQEVCSKIMNKMLELERYSTGKDKKTYMMIPSNHQTYPFPLNIEDRRDHIVTKINDNIKININMKINKIEKTINKQKINTYNIVIQKNNNILEFEDYLKQLGATITKDSYNIYIE